MKLAVLGGVISFLMVRSYDRSSMPSLLYLCWIIPVAAAVFDIHCGPFVFSAPGNPRSETTVRLLELDSIQNRLELIGRKMERLEHIKNLVEGVSSEVKPTLKRILIEDLEEHCSAESEYSGMVRTFVDTLMPHGWANNAADTCEE